MGGMTETFLNIGAKVVCVEPQDVCIGVLQQKYGKNPNVALVKKGLASKKGEMIFYICEGAHTISTFSSKWKTGRFSNYEWAKTKLVSVTTLDALIEEFGLPVFCKIDVEGFELQVLQGLSHPIPYISFEYTAEFLDDAKSCAQHLSSLGNVRFNFTLGGIGLRMISEKWMTSDELIKELTSIRENKMRHPTANRPIWGDIYAKFKDKDERL